MKNYIFSYVFLSCDWTFFIPSLNVLTGWIVDTVKRVPFLNSMVKSLSYMDRSDVSWSYSRKRCLCGPGSTGPVSWGSSPVLSLKPTTLSSGRQLLHRVFTYGKVSRASLANFLLIVKDALSTAREYMLLLIFKDSEVDLTLRPGCNYYFFLNIGMVFSFISVIQSLFFQSPFEKLTVLI